MYFAARMYACPEQFWNPVLGRWHSPDPIEQFHSPYLAVFDISYVLRSETLEMLIPQRSIAGCDNPANFVDPDGRAGIPWLQDFMESDVGMLSMGALACIGGTTFMAGVLENLPAIGGIMKNVVSFGLSLLSGKGIVNSLKSIAQIAGQTLVSNTNQTNFFVSQSHSNASSNSSVKNKESSALKSAICLLVTPSGKTALKNQHTNINAIARQIRKNLKAMDLSDINVHVWIGDPRNFDMTLLDKTSGVAVFGGNRDDTVKFIREELDPVFADRD